MARRACADERLAVHSIKGTDGEPSWRKSTCDETCPDSDQRRPTREAQSHPEVTAKALAKVAVVISSYDAERHIAEAIGSVLSQNMEDLEIVVQDDASTDRTVEIARSFDDKRLRVLASSTNRGAVANFNSGIAATRAPFIIKLDADDFLLNDHVRTCFQALSSDPDLAFAFTQSYDLHEDGTALLSLDWQEDQRFCGPAFIRCALERPRSWNASSFMLRRSAFLTAGQYRFPLKKPYGEDFALWLRMSVFGSAQYISRPLAVSRRHRLGLSGRLWRPEVRSVLRAMNNEVQAACELAKEEGVLSATEMPEIKKALARRWVWTADACAFVPGEWHYCLRKAWSLSAPDTLLSRALWRLLAKLALGFRLTEGIRNRRTRAGRSLPIHP
jgi:hypothetical protein